MTVSRGARRNAIALSIFLASTAIAADVVTDANAKAGDFIAAAKLAHNGANYRAAAIVQVAVFEAVNAVTGRFPNARLKLDPAPSASIDAAVLSATRSALVALTPSQQAQVEAWYAEALAAVLESPAKAAGVALGGKAAAGVLALCAGDGSNLPETWKPVTIPGVYVATPLPLMTQWGKRNPWVLARPDQLRPGPPPSLKSETWAHDFNEIKTLGAKNSAARTAEQTAAAKFWEASAPAIYFGIVRSFAAAPGRDVGENAHLYAVVAMAMDDALVAVMDAKYTYKFWRPITAIRNADRTQNRATEGNPGWLPFIDTPPHPEYPCAHCIVASAAATVLEAAMGDAPAKLSGTSATLPGAVRSWSKPSELVAEVGEARICDGVHYRNSTVVGAEMGKKLGQLVVAKELRLATKP